ncbi:2-dehydro-3-deoxygalactonokinase [Tabrizicola soli]|uniref:2-dehydro-3-deoxygalactonokinase n=1 Tax=Tabrizicola soli TaxID=2185115 RepID=A0ABV7E0W7_9RHOB|nr:2-dehydro-3-deoxygalactonokinase [Tabrizicola soli]
MTGPFQPAWIAVDWGTSNLRAWAMAADGCVLAETGSDEGMGRLTPGEFEPALLRLISPWLEGRPPVVACGMVGARQGWREAPYRKVPCAPLDPAAMILAPTTDPRLHVSIAPGLMQARPADVMRGEETQIAGALRLMPDYDGVICLPGTHSKWAHVSAGEVVSFQTFMTGEIFALLSEASVLRHGMQGGGWDEEAFDSSVSDALSRPERLAARLFSLRAEGLVAELAPGTARARLSGLLIGAELAAARPYWLGQRVTLIGSAALAAAYARALAVQGVEAAHLAAADCTLAGLAALAPRTEATSP